MPEPFDNINNILSGKICPYCEGQTEYVDSVEIYGKSMGMIYLCRPCRAWVGVHRGTNKALGRLANQELRDWKQTTHIYFDGLWKKLMSHGVSVQRARQACYAWLANQLQLTVERTHIGMFDVAQCITACECIQDLPKSGGLQSVLQHDEFVNRPDLVPQREKDRVTIEQQSFDGRDKYLRDVIALLDQFGKDHQILFTVIQPNQLRLSDREQTLDINPFTRKYHDVKSSAMGYYGHLPGFLDRFFGFAGPDLGF